MLHCCHQQKPKTNLFFLNPEGFSPFVCDDGPQALPSCDKAIKIIFVIVVVFTKTTTTACMPEVSRVSGPNCVIKNTFCFHICGNVIFEKPLPGCDVTQSEIRLCQSFCALSVYIFCLFTYFYSKLLLHKSEQPKHTLFKVSICHILYIKFCVSTFFFKSIFENVQYRSSGQSIKEPLLIIL